VNADCDVAIIGSGFSGSLLAMMARRLGHSVVLIERGTHPRFAMGESSTPLANLLLENIATTYDLPRLRPFCEWGSWQKAYPEIACGLKRGFTFFHHEFEKPWSRRPDYANQLLVAASPHDAVADTHWYRADFDHFLLREAQMLGAEYLDQTQLTAASPSSGGLRLEGTRSGRTVEIRARFVVDASGPRGFLHRTLSLPARPWPEMPAIAGLYSHFTNVHRWDELFAGEPTPYPVDDAAVHHVFPGGWIWVLRFNNGITSAGVAATSPLRLDAKDAWRDLLKSLPSVQAQFANASQVFPLVHAADLPFRCGTVVGPNWALMPSAAGFIDPLLSTGFPLTLMGVQRLGEVLQQLDHPGKALENYERITLAEIDRAAGLVAALYRNMDRPHVFNVLTLLYFAAASFTEAACRLNRPGLTGRSFLLGDHSTFAPALSQCIALALDRADPPRISKHVLSAIAPIDIAGLSDFSRRNSYGVLASDLHAAGRKLHATTAEIDEMLSRCGFIAK
jgi:tetracycline 7-halogenase / FADH2 O2-dependent halogenase